MSNEIKNESGPAPNQGKKVSLEDLFTPGGFRKTEGTCYSRPLDKPNKKKPKGSDSGDAENENTASMDY